MNNSRRDFFKSIVPKMKEKKEVGTEQDLFILGHLTCFPVDTTTKIRLREIDLILESLPEGMRLQDEATKKNFKLSLNSGGLVQAHMNEAWPGSAVLSIFTGEIYNV